MNRADTTSERTAGGARGPEIRAAQLKENLAALDELGPERAGRVRARLRPETLTAIGEAARHEWSPMELYLELARAVADALGDGALRSWSARSVARATEAPLLAPIFSAAVNLFGLTPAGLVRRASVVWSAVFRNCGELRVLACDSQRATLELGPLPPPIRSSTFLTSVAGSFGAVYLLCRTTGDAGLDWRAPDGDVARFEMTWPAAPDGR